VALRRSPSAASTSTTPRQRMRASPPRSSLRKRSRCVSAKPRSAGSPLVVLGLARVRERGAPHGLPPQRRAAAVRGGRPEDDHRRVGVLARAPVNVDQKRLALGHHEAHPAAGDCLPHELRVRPAPVALRARLARRQPRGRRPALAHGAHAAACRMPPPIDTMTQRGGARLSPPNTAPLSSSRASRPTFLAAFLRVGSMPALLPCGAPCPDDRDVTPDQSRLERRGRLRFSRATYGPLCAHIGRIGSRFGAHAST
jgi:hypothetical protein